MRSNRSALMAASLMAMVASAGVATDVLNQVLPRSPRPQPRAKVTPEQRTEIQAWNEAVQAKRDAKLARKGKARRKAVYEKKAVIA